MAAAAGLTAVIAAGLLSYAVFLGIEWVRDAPSDPVNAALVIAFSALWGVGLLACARGLLDRRRWARAPAVTSALLLLTVGWLLATGHGPEVVAGWVVLILTVACLVALLRPTVGHALR